MRNHRFIALFQMLLSVVLVGLVNVVFAGGGRIDMSSESGVANSDAAEVRAIVYTDDTLAQPSVGEHGTIVFESAGSGQSCDTYQPTSDSNGYIKASCVSSQVGSFVARLVLDGGEERTVALNFSSPAPSPQILSGNYVLTANHESVKLTNAINTGFGVNVTLRDAASNDAVWDQTGIDYEWKVGNSEIVRLTSTSSMCINGVLPPCPKVNGQFEGYKPGNTTVRVITKKDGAVLAETTISITVTQADGAAYYYPPTPTPAPASPSSSPVASPTAATKTNTTSFSATTPSTESGTPSPSALDTEATMQPNPSPATTESASNSSQNGSWGVALLVLAGLTVGLGAPITWYLLETNPEAKRKLLQQMARYRKMWKKKLSV